MWTGKHTQISKIHFQAMCTQAQSEAGTTVSRFNEVFDQVQDNLLVVRRE